MTQSTTRSEARFDTFSEFYPFYLDEHRNPTCRRLHFIGSTLVLLLVAYAIAAATWGVLLLVPIAGYGCAWIGHFFFEKNKPATFKYPLYSLMGDWVMYWDILRRRIPF